jgi:hypothetical protein
MTYIIAVFIIWLISLSLLAIGGAEVFILFEKGQLFTDKGYIALGVFFFGILLNFLVVNWPIGGAVIPVEERPALDENTLKALKIMAKTVTLAPRAVKEGLEKIIQKFE